MKFPKIRECPLIEVRYFVRVRWIQNDLCCFLPFLSDAKRSNPLSIKMSLGTTTLGKCFLLSPSLSSRRQRPFRNLASFVLTSVMVVSSSSNSNSASTRAFSLGQTPDRRYAYEPPSWAKDQFQHFPTSGRLHLANLPTPLVKVNTKSSSRRPTTATQPSSPSVLERLQDLDISLYIKRDDMTGGCETGGNKIRKLEFLLAEALEQKYTSVVTIGGEQSNHCRATAGACRMVGLEPHLILRTARANTLQQQDSNNNADVTSSNIGYAGNILFDRMVASTIYTCTPGEYGRIGSTELVSRLCDHLNEQTQYGMAYPIPVGGSNALGTWGYIDAVDELLTQWNSVEGNPSSPTLDHVVVACGSGGTAAGVSIGMALACTQQPGGSPPEVHAIGVCDSPNYFYEHIAKIAKEMGLKTDGMTDADGCTITSLEDYIRQIITVHHGKGSGYAVSTPEELQFITDFAMETGIVLDPVYTGKALYHFFTKVLEGGDDKDLEKYRGKNILFWHTGGALGLFDKGNDLLSTMDRISPTKRLDLYGKGMNHGVDISRPSTKVTST